MKRLFRLFCWLVLVGYVQWVFTQPASAGVASDEMKATIESVLTTLQDPDLQGPEKRGERRDRLKKIIYPKFDFAEMGKRSLGSHWQRRTPEEKKAFIELFTELVETSYIDAIDAYNSEKVIVGSDKQDQGFAEVSSKIVSKKGEGFAVDYKLHQSGEGWKVYDVVIENVSLVNNYRSQFNRVISKASYAELVEKMKQKQFDSPGKKRKS